MSQSIIEESRRARKKGIFSFLLQKKMLLAVAILAVAAGGYYYYFINNASNSQAAQVQKKSYITKKEDIQIAIQSEGKVVAKDGVELSFPVSGNLEVDNVYVKEGDKVKKGDKIASVKTETLQFELRNAYASYQSALASFNTKQAGATDSEIVKSKSSIEQAQVSLDQAKLSLATTKSSIAQQITNAESSVASAENNLKLNKDINDSAIVKNAYSDLVTTIKSVSVTLERVLRDSDSIIGVDDTGANDNFEDVLGVKDSSSLNIAKSSYAQTKTLKKELNSYVVSLTSSNTVMVDAASAKADSAMNAVQNHLFDMQAMLEATITSTDMTQSELDGFKSTINTNRSTINSSISSLDKSNQAVDNAKSSLTGFQISYNKAVNDLKVIKEQSVQDIENANISVKSRELSLQQAKNDYNDLIAPASESDLASARAQLTSSAISVDRAKYNVEQATLISPIDGVVSMLNYKKGDIILSDSAKSMATIINNDTLFIEVNIEEADISKIKSGQKAEATFDAIDGLELDGDVSFIAMTSQTSSNGIVTYLVRVVLSNVSESQVREGMTASINFITAEAKDVISIPVAAVRNISDKPSVIMSDGSIVPVITGFTDGKKVEVISGLKEGDQITY